MAEQVKDSNVKQNVQTSASQTAPGNIPPGQVGGKNVGVTESFRPQGTSPGVNPTESPSGPPQTDQDKKLSEIKVSPDDPVDEVMRKMSKAKQTFDDSEKDIVRLEGELAAAREHRTRVFTEFQGLKSMFGRLSEIAK